jgi:aminoglycoside 2'-N-acetyltransferase I
MIGSSSGRLEIVNGDEGWRLAASLLEAVRPQQVAATLPWKDVVWAHADSRVIKINWQNDVIGHAGIYLRTAAFDARPVKIGGVGGVATRLDFRGRGIASEVMREAVREMGDGG